MQKELEMWKAENDRHSEAIRKEERCMYMYNIFLLHMYIIAIMDNHCCWLLHCNIWSLQHNRARVISIKSTT